MPRNKRLRSYSCWSYSESLGVTPGFSKSKIGNCLGVLFFRAHISSMAYKGVKQARTLNAGIMSSIYCFWCGVIY